MTSQPHALTEEPTEQVYEEQATQWGPFLDYTIVTTPHGEYGVPARKILTFSWVDVLNKETMQMEPEPRPQYEDVKMDDPRLKPLDTDAVNQAAAVAPNAEAAVEAKAVYDEAVALAEEVSSEKDAKIKELEAKLKGANMKAGRDKKQIERLKAEQE